VCLYISTGNKHQELLALGCLFEEELVIVKLSLYLVAWVSVASSSVVDGAFLVDLINLLNHLGSLLLLISGDSIKLL
jgi:hypothetical protein